MNISKRIAFLLLLTAFAAMTLVAADKKPEEKPAEKVEKKEIVWHSFDEGLKKAEKENKHIFIDFTAKWCGYCRKMEREVFTDQRIIDLLNNDFVSVKVDGDSKKELDIDGYKITERSLTVKEFGVRGYPTFWFLKPDGTKLGPIGGYRPTEFMLEALAYVKDYQYDSTTTEADSSAN